jgi:hypothetical protein
MANSDDNQQFILVAIKGKHHRPVCGPAVIKIIGAQRSSLTKQPQWRGYTFQIRTPDGYRAVPILEKNNSSGTLIKARKHAAEPTWQPYKD